MLDFYLLFIHENLFFNFCNFLEVWVNKGVKRVVRKKSRSIVLLWKNAGRVIQSVELYCCFFLLILLLFYKQLYCFFLIIIWKLLIRMLKFLLLVVLIKKKKKLLKTFPKEITKNCQKINNKKLQKDKKKKAKSCC